MACLDPYWAQLVPRLMPMVLFVYLMSFAVCIALFRLLYYVYALVFILYNLKGHCECLVHFCCLEPPSLNYYDYNLRRDFFVRFVTYVCNT